MVRDTHEPRLMRFVHPDVMDYVEACFGHLRYLMARAEGDPKALRPSGDVLLAWALPQPVPVVDGARADLMVESAVLRKLLDEGVRVREILPLEQDCSYTIHWCR